MNIREEIESGVLFDSAIVSYGFTSYMRDYDLNLEVPSQDKSELWRYRFTHCVRAICETVLSDNNWQASWNDTFINYRAWEKSGNPASFVWGVSRADAYPGGKYIQDSSLAKLWTQRLAKHMHEVYIETNTYKLELVFHGLEVIKSSDTSSS